MNTNPSRYRPVLASVALAALLVCGQSVTAAPGEDTSGPKVLGICQSLLGEESSFSEVITDWSVEKTVDIQSADQPRRQGINYNITLVEGQSRYVLGMTSILTLDGLIPPSVDDSNPDGITQVRGIVMSLSHATPVAPPDEPLYTTVAGALLGDANATCGCPYVDSGGDLTVTARDAQGEEIVIPDDGPLLVLEYGDRVILQLDVVYDLSSAVVLPGELVRIQACVQYAADNEYEQYPWCFDEGGAVRTIKACSSFDFEAYAKPESGKAVLEEVLTASDPWITLNGFKARSNSSLITPTATLEPVIPDEPVEFDVTASGESGTESTVAVKGDVSCADVVDCEQPDENGNCHGVVTNTATVYYDDDRDPVVASVDSNVTCTVRLCQGDASCDDENPCTDDVCIPDVGCENQIVEGRQCGDLCVGAECDAAGICVPTGQETVCSDDDNNSCTAEMCDPDLGCVVTNLADRSDCDDGDPCTIDDICIAGVCESGSGVSCHDGNPCTIDSCTGNGECNHAPIDGGAGSCEDGSACTVGDYCDQGECVSGPGPICEDDGNPCTIEDCVLGLGCTSIEVEDGESCEDGDACTTNDVCRGGKCRAGPPADCNDNNPCTNDGCDLELGCYNAPRVGACDDGSACTSASYCLDAVCTGTQFVDCDDGNPCTIDTCDPVVGCKHDIISTGQSCDDGDPCTIGETCQFGACVSSTLQECDDGNECTASTCVPHQGCVHVPTEGSCEDGNRCTENDLCLNGTCIAGNSVDCDDENVCTRDGCSPSTGCTHVPTSGSCDDGDICTGLGTCGGGECQKGEPISCDDGNPCTSGQCDSVQGCVQLQVGGSCDDNDPCTGIGTCQFGMCLKGAEIECDDGDECTADYCKAGVGCATLPRSNVPCEDGDPCTVNDVCMDGTCRSGDELDCDDGNVCTADSCGDGGCSYKPVAGGCNDDNQCTIGDTCQDGVCQPGPPKDCSDGDSCTSDVCVASTGACVNDRLAAGSVCDDGDSCTGCVWPEPEVDRGFHALDAKPDATIFPNAISAALELDQFIGPGTGKAWFNAMDDLRWVVLPNGTSYLRGTFVLQVGQDSSEEWEIELAFNFRGVGKAGQGATPYYELPAGMQDSVWTDAWEYWGLPGAGPLTRTEPSSDWAQLVADPGLQALPLQVGLRANGRNLTYGASMPVVWIRGTRSGTGVLRLNLEREHCSVADTCTSDACVAGTTVTECRDILPGDYCTYTAADFGETCTSDTLGSGACQLLQGFAGISVEQTACGSTVNGVALGRTGYARWTFSSAQAIGAFLPTSGAESTTVQLCNPGSTTATPEVGRVLALQLSIALSDAGALPAPGGVPLGELVRTSGSCAGLNLREIARRAEVVVSGASVGTGACTSLATLDAEVTAINAGFQNCLGVLGGVVLP